jgi:two-component system, NarL family, nitrate/nitrite response regulator NarL
MSQPVRPIRLLLLDDHALFREGLARLLAAEPDLEVVAHCASVAEAVQALTSKTVDLVLLDVDLGAERGLDFLLRARKEGFTGPVLVVTAGMAASEAALLISNGAAGLFLKQDSAQLLAEGIRTVAHGRAWIDQRSLASLVGSQQAPRAVDRTGLTAREREVLRGVFDGLANKEIASRLQVSESSIKAVLQQLFHKTGVRTRSQLVRIALERYAQEL